MKNEFMLRPGEQVKLIDSDCVGQVLRLEGHKKVRVSFDYAVVTVSLSQLEYISVAMQATRSTQKTVNTSIRLLNISKNEFSCFRTEIDLHGMYVQEALHALDKWLDKAALLGYKHLRIIHGIGQGKLRKAVRAYVRSHELVKKVVEQHCFQGTSGVTGIEL